MRLRITDTTPGTAPGVHLPEMIPRFREMYPLAVKLAERKGSCTVLYKGRSYLIQRVKEDTP
tara:strand:- start:361 stop:546 length:186 start_codon:yes stop_codon:yes gene_type:complete